MHRARRPLFALAMAAVLIGAGANWPAAQERVLSAEEALQRLTDAYETAAKTGPLLLDDGPFMFPGGAAGVLAGECRLPEAESERQVLVQYAAAAKDYAMSRLRHPLHAMLLFPAGEYVGRHVDCASAPVRAFAGRLARLADSRFRGSIY